MTNRSPRRPLPTRLLSCGVLFGLLAGCAQDAQRYNMGRDAINSELERANRDARSRPAPVAQPATPEAVAQALLPPLIVQAPASAQQAPEPRFDLAVNNAPAARRSGRLDA